MRPTLHLQSLILVFGFLALTSSARAFQCPERITAKFTHISAEPIDETMSKYPDLLQARDGVAALSELTSILSLFDFRHDGAGAVCFYRDEMVPADQTRVHYLWHRANVAGVTGKVASLTWLNTWVVTSTGVRFGLGLYLEFVSATEMTLRPVTPANQPQFPLGLTATTLRDPNCQPVPVGDAGAILCPTVTSQVGTIGRVQLVPSIRQSPFLQGLHDL